MRFPLGHILNTTTPSYKLPDARLQVWESGRYMRKPEVTPDTEVARKINSRTTFIRISVSGQPILSLVLGRHTYNDPGT